jgi:hypothetical protein
MINGKALTSEESPLPPQPTVKIELKESIVEEEEEFTKEETEEETTTEENSSVDATNLLIDEDEEEEEKPKTEETEEEKAPEDQPVTDIKAMMEAQGIIAEEEEEDEEVAEEDEIVNEPLAAVLEKIKENEYKGMVIDPITKEYKVKNGKIVTEIRPINIRMKHNMVTKDGKSYISLSDVETVTGDKISDLISQLMETMRIRK